MDQTALAFIFRFEVKVTHHCLVFSFDYIRRISVFKSWYIFMNYFLLRGVRRLRISMFEQAFLVCHLFVCKVSILWINKLPSVCIKMESTLSVHFCFSSFARIYTGSDFEKYWVIFRETTSSKHHIQLNYINESLLKNRKK